MKIAIGSDHAGVGLKTEIIDFLRQLKHEYQDFGAYDTNAVDYPDVAKVVTENVVNGQADAGILICGTGIGMSMAANKVHGIRASLCHDTFSARATREHNNANVLCLGARVIGAGLALDIVEMWLSTPFSNADRHVQRVNKIGQMER
jgi:ribose 5-phosphate isomerase B